MSRYDEVKIITDKKISRLGTVDFQKFEEKNTDILLIATEGDRCDLISQLYYGSPEHWWFVASVNKLSSNNIGTSKTKIKCQNLKTDCLGKMLTKLR